MFSRIEHFELNWQMVLGFDTGLDSQAFAQAKMAQFITQNGYLIFPGGRTELWKAVGVIERSGQNGKPPSMVIWGPDFPGIGLDTLIRDPARSEEALDAVKYYLEARIFLGNENPLYYGAAGAFICTGDTENFPRGMVMFPPERLIKRCIEAGGDEEVNGAMLWVHPDFKGDDQIVFCGAAMVYAIFAGEPPFLSKDTDTLRQDIREGVFIPPRLAAPGLNQELCEIITGALEPDKKKANEKKRPAPNQLLEVLGRPGEKKTWFMPMENAEQQKIRNELDLYKKNRNFTVKTRRFVVRNTTILLVCLATLVGAGLIVRSYIKRLEEMPNTRGMVPVEVAETYYGAFETMDHETMESCISGKKAKFDVDMILNLYVITRTRQAYEPTETNIAARDWLDRGSPQTNATVFGVTNLDIKFLGEDEEKGETLLEASYILWMPASFAGDDTDLPSEEEMMSGNFINPPPRGYRYIDELLLSWVKDSWRITEINRTVVP